MTGEKLPPGLADTSLARRSKEHAALPDSGGWMTNFVNVAVEHAELIWSGNG
jgi:hypothetical protein